MGVSLSLLLTHSLKKLCFRLFCRLFFPRSISSGSRFCERYIWAGCHVIQLVVRLCYDFLN